MIRPGIRRLLRLPGAGSTVAGEVDEEIRFHLESRVDELVRMGWSEEEAQAEARRRFGDLTIGRRDMERSAIHRSRRLGAREWLSTAGQDLRFGARQLGRNPGFTAAAVLTLGLGIGANTAIFSFVDALLLRPPPHVSQPDRVFHVYTSDFSGPLYGASSYPDYVDFADRLEGSAELASSAQSPMTVAFREQTELIDVEYVTPNYFQLLGVDAAVGRLLPPAAASSTAPEPEIVLGYDFWQRAFRGDPAVLGEVIRLNGQPLTVVGVAPRGFAGPGGRRPSDGYLPMGMMAVFRAPPAGADVQARGQPAANAEGAPPTSRSPAANDIFAQRSSRGLSVVGRPRPDASLDAVRSRLEEIGASLFSEYPEEWTDVRDRPRQVTTIAGRAGWISPSAHGMMLGFAGLLAGLVGVVLLIACANVASLLLARATKRRQEFAVRLAMGAGRARLIRQLITESLLLAGGGAVLGLSLALLTMSVLRRLADALPFNATLDVRLDLRVLLFAVGISILAAVFFALLPAVMTARKDPVPILKSEGTAGGREGSLMRAGLVAAQVSICVIFLICASVLVRTLRSTVQTDLGFEPSGVLLVPLTLPPDRYDAETGPNLYRAIVERVGGLPGVTAVALGDQVPLGGRYQRSGVDPEGYQRNPGEDMEVDWGAVTPGYLELMRIPVVRGRSITEADQSGAPRVAVVNQACADRFWPGEDPIGKRFGFRTREPGVPPVEIVGVTPTGTLRAINEEPRANLYVPVAQLYRNRLHLHVRTEGNPADLFPSVRAELLAIEPDLPITGSQTFESVIAGQVLLLRMAGTLFTGFGLLALTIAMVGLYGMLAYAVGQRTREIGIRIAIGARGGRLALGVVRRGLILVALGALIGVLGGQLATRPLAFLFGVEAADPWGMAGVVGLLAVVSLLAAYLPARRATRVDPVVALREG